MNYNWRQYGPEVRNWMTGKSHVRPLMDWYVALEAESIRQANFQGVCRTCDPEIVIWPEFEARLKQYNLLEAYQKGTFSAEVAGLLLLGSSTKIGDWLKRGPWLSRRGKDPLKRRKYRGAMRQIYQATSVARKMAERRHFESIAIQAMNE